MGVPSFLHLFVIAVLPFIQGTTPEYFRSMGQPMGIGGTPEYVRSMGQPMGIGGDPAGDGMYPNEDYTGGQSQGYGSRYGSSSGRIWCTCRRRCRYSEWTFRYTCTVPFNPRYWRTCCKYLRNYQTSSMYRGYGGSPYSQYPQSYPGSMYRRTSPYQQDLQVSDPGSMYGGPLPYTQDPIYPGMGQGRLPPKGV
ncbi:unnamed protein product [Mytilus edulis]|uniref:Uncharacterized protein n=1 Tax=Mytilus edulis TaxID=6550 RepID=A0A8S3T2I8_MYTED|nr:unnamed protein product [Mytilus edulis]